MILGVVAVAASALLSSLSLGAVATPLALSRD